MVNYFPLLAQTKKSIFILPYPLDGNVARIKRVSSRLLAILDKRLTSPSGVKASSANDPLYQSVLAFRDAIKNHLDVIRTDTLQGGPVAAGFTVLMNGRPANRAVVNSLILDPLLGLALDPFYEDLVISIAAKEGAAFAQYRTPARRAILEEVQRRAQAFALHPFAPVTEAQQEEIRKIGGGMAEWESVGLSRVVEWLTRANIGPAQVTAHRATTLEVTAFRREIHTLLRDFSVGLNANQREIIVKSHVLRLELKVLNASLVNAILQLPEVRRQTGPNGDIFNAESALGWMLLPKYRFPTWTPAKSRRGLFLMLFPGTRNSPHPLPRVSPLFSAA